jgi:hypothetical protein
MVTRWLQTQTTLKMTVGLMMVSCLARMEMMEMIQRKSGLFSSLSRAPEMSRFATLGIMIWNLLQ